VQLRLQRSLPAAPIEDAETMSIKASMVPQLYVSYARLRTELLEKLRERLLVEAEENLYADSLVSRRQYQANPSSDIVPRIERCCPLKAPWRLLPGCRTRPYVRIAPDAG
jgi:hypothetical protein